MLSASARELGSAAPVTTMGCATLSAARCMASSEARRPRSLSTGGGAPSALASSSSARALASVDLRRCSADANSVLVDEPVSNPTDRLDPTRLAQLAPDLVHRLLHAVLEAGIGAAPD